MKREQEEENKRREKEDSERRRKAQEKKWIKKFLESAFDGELEELKKIIKDVYSANLILLYYLYFQ